MLLTLRAVGNSKWCKAINSFLHSAYYIAVVAVLGACANLFGLELPVWYAFAVLVGVIALFSEDALPVVPMLGCGYVSVSASNNPAGHYGTSLFQNRTALIQLAVIAAFIVAGLAARLIFDLCRPHSDARTRRVPSLLVGFALLGLAYVVAGVIPARDYGPQWKSALFGLVQIVCLAGPYLYFHYTVNWSKVSRIYLAQCFVGLGFAIMAEIVGMYVLAFNSLKDGGDFSRSLLVTGWGIYNNVGMLIAFCIPFAFNLALRCRRGYIYVIIAELFETALIFTQSRGSILFGTLIFAACAIYTAVQLKGKYRWFALAAFAGFFVVVVIVCAIFYREVADIFDTMKKAGMDDSGRWEIYLEGLRQFAESAQSVLLGNGFYACGNYRYGDLPSDAFLPPRYHNTVVQLLATGGIFAMVTYLFHRYGTLRLCLTHRTHEKMFVIAAISVLTLTSLVDCHFFNMGPGLVYSVILVFAEDLPSTDELPKLFGKRQTKTIKQTA